MWGNLPAYGYFRTLRARERNVTQFLKVKEVLARVKGIELSFHSARRTRKAAHRGYTHHELEKLRAAVEKSPRFIEFNSRLPDVIKHS